MGPLTAYQRNIKTDSLNCISNTKRKRVVTQRTHQNTQTPLNRPCVTNRFARYQILTRMNTQLILKTSLLVCILGILGLLFSCSSDDSDDMMDGGDNPDELSLSFTLDGVSYQAVFETGGGLLAVDGGSVTLISASGRLDDDTPYVFATTFDGNTPGTYTLTQEAGSEEDDFSGLSILLVDGANSLTYSATNVTLTISSYQVISLAEIIIKGTFSGTVINDETEETATITNGSFVTGFKN